AAAVLHATGESKAAAELVERLVAELGVRNAADRDLPRYVRLAETAVAIGRPELAEECMIRASAVPWPGDDLGDLLEAAGIAPGERAGRWWKVLREKYKEPV